MARISIVFGVLLILLGVGAYALSESKSPTPFIPSAFGLILVVCGVIALKDHLRKHAMHAAVVVGLIGFIAALVRLILWLLSWNENSKSLVAGSLAGMALLCGAFVVLCVKSFIDARRARKKE